MTEFIRQDTEAWLAQVPGIIELARKLAAHGQYQETGGLGKFDASICRHCGRKLNDDLPAVKTRTYESLELAAGARDGITIEVNEGPGVFNIDILEVKDDWCDIDRPLFSITLRQSGWLERLRGTQEAPQVT